MPTIYYKNRLLAWFKEQENRGVTLAEISHVSGIAVATLSRMKHGRREPPRKQLVVLMDLTGLDLYDLMRIARPAPGLKPARADIGALAAASKRGKALAVTAGPDFEARAPEAIQACPHKASPELLGLRPSREQVQLALRYRLQPGAAWRAFLEAPATRLEAIDGQWRAWCEACGVIPGTPGDARPAALGRPGELYAHLKPLERADFRPEPAGPGPGMPGVRLVR